MASYESLSKREARQCESVINGGNGGNGYRSNLKKSLAWRKLNVAINHQQ